MKQRRNISALLLLTVFLARIAVLSVHTHEPVYHADYECELCEHHTCHSGHLIELQLADSDCLICQLCQLPYAMALSITVAALLFLTRYIRAAECVLIPCNRYGCILGRAPLVI